MEYPPEYWDKIYNTNKVGWDIGYISTPLKEYVDQLKDKDISILVPGAGQAYEVEYLYKMGFKNTFLLDYSKKSISLFLERLPDFPCSQIFIEDFFRHNKKYDLIIEQTFFSSIPKASRKAYAKKIFELLKPEGRICGLLFNHEFQLKEPPFGGTINEYQKLFENKFIFKQFDTAYNSIRPRRNRELFFCLQKPLN